MIANIPALTPTHPSKMAKRWPKPLVHLRLGDRVACAWARDGDSGETDVAQITCAVCRRIFRTLAAPPAESEKEIPMVSTEPLEDAEEQIEKLRTALVNMIPFGIEDDGFACLACKSGNHELGHLDPACPVGQALSVWLNSSGWARKQNLAQKAKTEPQSEGEAPDGNP